MPITNLSGLGRDSPWAMRSDLQRFAVIDGARLVPVTDLHRSPVGSCLARPRLYDRFCGQLLGS